MAEPLVINTGPIVALCLAGATAAVIELALRRRIGLVAIDEARGRRAAAAAGLTVTGPLGLLGLAKIRGLIPAVAPHVVAMRASGVYLDDALVNRFLAAVDEASA